MWDVGPLGGAIPAAAAPGVPLALDGTPVRNIATGGGIVSLTVNGVTTSPGDIMIVMHGGNTASAVSGTVTGAFTKLCDVTGGSGGYGSLWWAVAVAGAPTTENITISQTSNSYAEAVCFGVKGADLVAPWDTLTGSSFVTNAVFHTAGPTVTTTASVPEMVLGLSVDAGGAGPYSPDTGWTTLSAAVTCGIDQYRIEPSTGSFQINVGAANFFHCSIGAALKQHP